MKRRSRLSVLRAVSSCLAAFLLAGLSQGQSGTGSFDPSQGAADTQPAELPAPEPSAAPETPVSPTAPAAAPADRTARRIELLTDHYLRLYSKHLQSKDWISRVMGLISLSRIDHPQTTEKMLHLLKTDPVHVVRVYAWECLHARAALLTDEQRDTWAKAGLSLALQNGFHGHLRAGAVSAAAPYGPTDDNRKLFAGLFQQTNLQNKSDATTLVAMRKALAAWKDPELAEPLVLAMSNLNDAWRAEFVLRGLGPKVPSSQTHHKLGSDAMWKLTQAAWAQHLTANKLTAASNLKPYLGPSDLIKGPQKITDPDDERWRKDLELRRLELDQLDVAFVVDSTGSMGEVIGWLRRDVLKMLRAMGMMSREPRIGIVFYRDYGDRFVVKPVPLTGSGQNLVKAVSGATAEGGGDIPEAVGEALYTALTSLEWSKGPSTLRALILIGDAPPHPQSMGKIKELVESAGKHGLRFFCIKVRTKYGQKDLSTFDEIARWGGGCAVQIDLDKYRISDRENWHPGPSHLIVKEVFRGILGADYHDRVEPFVNVLMEYVDLPVREHRKPFGPWRPPKKDVEPRKPKPRKPFDPQKQR